MYTYVLFQPVFSGETLKDLPAFCILMMVINEERKRERENGNISHLTDKLTIGSWLLTVYFATEEELSLG